MTNHTLNRRAFLGTSMAAGAALSLSAVSLGGETSRKLTVVVMDPLSAPLACDCVQGYAQRQYEHLGAFLEQRLGLPVQVVWHESLKTALKEKTAGRADLVIGKHSVVLSDARELQLKVEPVASLTGKDGKTTQSGLIVVRKDDPALTVADLNGYRFFFGPKACDEKYSAPLALLKTFNVSVPEQEETCSSCSIAATQLMELPAGEKAAAIISSYAEPLLEGCGTIQKGDLRVVGESQVVPFITAFSTAQVEDDLKTRLAAALLEVGAQPELLIALETKTGFVAFQQPQPGQKKKAPR